MMQESGITQIIGCDRQGAISTDRADYGDGSMSGIKKLVRREHQSREALAAAPTR